MNTLEPQQRAASNPVGYDYNSIQTGYYDHVYRKKAGIQSKWHHLKFAHIRAQIPSGVRHLDIGCGPGTFIGSLDESIESIGVDIAADQIKYARANYGSPQKQFELVDADQLPFADDAFDVATCVELVEHLARDNGARLAAEIRRVLRPGGVLLMTTPDYGGAWPMLEWLVNRLGDVSYEDQHITHFNKLDLANMLADAGFENTCVGRYQFLSPFFTPFGWKFADQVARLEPKFLTAKLGFLLLAEASSDKV